MVDNDWKLKGGDQILTLLLNTSLPLGNLYRASIKLFNFAVIYCSFSNSNGNTGSVYCLLSLVELDYSPSCPFKQRWHSSLWRATARGSPNKAWQNLGVEVVSPDYIPEWTWEWFFWPSEHNCNWSNIINRKNKQTNKSTIKGSIPSNSGISTKKKKLIKKNKHFLFLKGKK